MLRLLQVQVLRLPASGRTRPPMVRRYRAVALAAAVTAAMSACADADPGASTPTTSASTVSASPSGAQPSLPTAPPSTPTEEGTAMASETPNSEILQEVVATAKRDLSDRVGGEGEFEVVLARKETFPNGALGCPREGEMYTQALVDGYRVVLGRNDRVWVYTAGRDGVPQLCPSEAKDGGHDFVPPPGIDE